MVLTNRLNAVLNKFFFLKVWSSQNWRNCHCLYFHSFCFFTNWFQSNLWFQINLIFPPLLPNFPNQLKNSEISDHLKKMFQQLIHKHGNPDIWWKLEITIAQLKICHYGLTNSLCWKSPIPRLIQPTLSSL